MWTSEAHTATAEAWQAHLAAAPPAPAAQQAAKYVLQLLLRAPELYVGNDTPFLLQLLGGPGEAGELDVVASLLAPDGDEEGTHLCCTLRGPAVHGLVAGFLEQYPEAPVLVERAPQVFDYVLCEVDDEPWSRGPITLTRLRMLRGLNGRERLRFLLPAEQPAEQPARAPRFAPRPAQYLT